MVKIGILNLCMKEYLHSVSDRLIDQLKDKMGKDVEWVYFGKSFHMDDVIKHSCSLKKELPDYILILFGTWADASLGMTAYEQLINYPLLFWAIPMIEGNSTGSFVAFCVLKGTLERLGIKFDWKLCLPNEIASVLVNKTRLHRIKSELRNMKLGLFGYAAMGIYTATFNHLGIKHKIGPEVIHVDNVLVLNTMKGLDREIVEFEKEKFYCRFPLHSPKLKPSSDRTLMVYLAMKEIIKSYNMSGVTAKCMFEMSRSIGCSCIPLSLLVDDGIMCSDEGDIYALITMIFMNKLSGQPCFFSDVINAEKQNLWFSTCGFIAPSLVDGNIEINQQVEEIGTEGVVFSGKPKKGLVTIARLEESSDNGYKMHITKGIVDEGYLRKHVTKAGKELNLFPICKVRLEYNVMFFLKNVCSNHYILCWDDIVCELEELCKLLKIKVLKDV